jgi:hypothetical protein
LIDPLRWRDPPPWRHQIVGAKARVNRPAFFIGDVPRIGKSRQVVDAACELRTADDGIRTDVPRVVVLVCPVAARGVWGDKELGQIKRYAWRTSRVLQLHSRVKELWSDGDELIWTITNYDWVRDESNLAELLDRLAAFGPTPSGKLLVLDESSAVGNHTSQQSKAIFKLRAAFSRCIMLNGTPGEPPKLWSQFNILDHVLDRRYSSYTTFKWQYTEYDKENTKLVWTKNPKGGPAIQRPVHRAIGWKNWQRLNSILDPYRIRRLRSDCPELRDIKIVYGFAEVPLSANTWRMYQELKKEAIISLSDGELYLSANSNTRLIRLAQIVSGHLGGFEPDLFNSDPGVPFEPVRDFSTEKIDWLIEKLGETTEECSIVWCRWVREREVLAKKLRASDFAVYEIHGGQKAGERRAAEAIFTDGAVREAGRRYVMLAQPQAGGVALDMSAATDVYRLSRDHNLRTEEQSGDRPLGQAQKLDAVPCTDVLATGPDGERTTDHTIRAAIIEKRNLAKMTTAWWRKELEAE